MEQIIGEANMQAFLNFYMREHSLTSITTVQLRETWEYWVENKMPTESPEEVNKVLASIDWETWMFAPGLPPVQLDFNTPESDASAALALEYISLAGNGSPENYEQYFDYYSNLKVVFHDTLQAHFDELTEDILVKIDADLGCTADIDPEVRQRWYPIGLSSMYQPVYDPAHDWISSMGRSKYLSPVYQALQDSGQHDLGVQWFDENKDFYHPVASTTIEGILGIEETANQWAEEPIATETKLEHFLHHIEDEARHAADFMHF